MRDLLSLPSMAEEVIDLTKDTPETQGRPNAEATGNEAQPTSERESTGGKKDDTCRAEEDLLNKEFERDEFLRRQLFSIGSREAARLYLILEGKI